MRELPAHIVRKLFMHSHRSARRHVSSNRRSAVADQTLCGRSQSASLHPRRVRRRLSASGETGLVIPPPVSARDLPLWSSPPKCHGMARRGCGRRALPVDKVDQGAMPEYIGHNEPRMAFGAVSFHYVSVQAEWRCLP